MPSEEEILAIEKAFSFKGLFGQDILDILKLMPEEQQNAKQANLAIFKQGERGGQLWRDYEAAGHNHKQLSSQISRILTKEKKENERKAAEGAAEGAAGHGVADSENEEGEDEQDLLQEDVDSEDHQGLVVTGLASGQQQDTLAAALAAEGMLGGDSENEEGEDEQDLVGPGSEEEEVALDAAVAAFLL